MPQIPTSDKERGPRSLKRMALAVALRNIASITDVGEMAFADAKPILTHIENPHQLHLLETNCPQLAAEPDQMAAVWGRLLTKKIPGWDTKGFLTDEELQTLSWIDVYTTVKAAIDAEMAAAEDRLKQTLAGFSKAKEDNATQLVNNRALTRKIPGVMTKKRGPGSSERGASVLNFGSGSRTKMTTGQSVLRRARREAKEISKVSQLSSRLTENQAVARSQIRKPPAAMIHDYRVAHQPGTGIIRPPKRRTGSAVTTHYETEGRIGAPGTGLGVGNATNEARLLALKTGSMAAASAAAAAAAASSYSAGPSVPAIHAPKKRVATSTTTSNAAPSRKPKEKRRTYDYDNDDELFGVVTQTSKRARLTVEDLEGGSGSGNDDDDDLFGSDDEPQSKPKSRSVVSSPPSRVPDRSRASAVGRDRERDSGRDRDRPRTERREDRSYDSPPKKSSARPSAPIASTTYKPPPAQTAGPPPRGQATGGGGVIRKRAVDIFMRPKKR